MHHACTLRGYSLCPVPFCTGHDTIQTCVQNIVNTCLHLSVSSVKKKKKKDTSHILFLLWRQQLKNTTSFKILSTTH